MGKIPVFVLSVFVVFILALIGLEYFFRYNIARECERITVFSLETAVKNTVIPPDNIKVFDRALATETFYDYLCSNADLDDSLNSILSENRPKIQSVIIDEFALYDPSNVFFPYPHGEEVFHELFGHVQIRYVINSLLYQYTITIHLDVAVEEYY